MSNLGKLLKPTGFSLPIFKRAALSDQGARKRFDAFERAFKDYVTEADFHPDDVLPLKGQTLRNLYAQAAELTNTSVAAIAAVVEHSLPAKVVEFMCPDIRSSGQSTVDKPAPRFMTAAAE